MTQEDRQLLLKDLCARLPYGVKINVDGEEDILLELGIDSGWINASYDVEDVKPYLRPMSSMTEEEEKEFIGINENVKSYGGHGYYAILNTDIQDWLNAHHFDYRGLIPMGLALEALEGMYEAE